MYKVFLCLRYLRKRRIAFFAVAAVTLCVAMVLIVVSVMGGFLQMVKDRSRGMLGDLVAENGALQGFPFYQEFIDEAKRQLPDMVEEATPVIISYGTLRYPVDQITKPVQIVGIRLEETYRVNEFKHGLFYETYYPGTTTFAPQKVPCYGLDEQRQALAAKLLTEGDPEYWYKPFKVDEPGKVILPSPLQEAWERWWASASPRERAAAPMPADFPYRQPGLYRVNPIIHGDRAPQPSELGPTWNDKELPGAILGADLCASRRSQGGYQRHYARGERVQITFVPVSSSGTISDATGMPSKVFRYVDDSRTGVYDIDSMSVYLDFDLTQQILAMNEQELDGGGKEPARATQVQFKLRPGVNALKARDAVEKIWESVRMRHIGEVRNPELMYQLTVQTWEQKQARFIAAVEKEKILVTVLFGIISLVAALLVGCILYMIVNQKTRDIGIIRSVGATAVGIGQIFVAFGMAIGVVGGLLGVALGTVFVWYINDIQDWLASKNEGLRVWSAEVYAFDRIPNEVDPTTAVVIYFSAIGLSMLGSLIAAWRAARVWPVEALRYE